MVVFNDRWNRGWFGKCSAQEMIWDNSRTFTVYSRTVKMLYR